MMPVERNCWESEPRTFQRSLPRTLRDWSVIAESASNEGVCSLQAVAPSECLVLRRRQLIDLMSSALYPNDP